METSASSALPAVPVFRASGRAPDFPCSFHHQRELALFLIDAERIALKRAREAALRAEGETVERVWPIQAALAAALGQFGWDSRAARANLARIADSLKSDDVEGRTRIYESMVKGTNVLEPGTPISFDVLTNEIRGLCLNLQLEKARV